MRDVMLLKCIIASDNQAAQGAKASATMILIMLSRNNSVLQLWVNNKKTTCIQSNMIQYIYWCVSTRDYRTMAAINDPQANTCHGYKELHNITDHRTMIAVKVQLTKKPTHYLAAHCYIIPQHYNDNAKIICRNRNIWCIHEHQQIIVSKGIKEVYKETTQLYITWQNHTDQNTDTTYWQMMLEFVGSSLCSDIHQLHDFPVTLYSRLLKASVLFTKHMVNSNDEIQLRHIQICCFTICISTWNIKLMF